MNVYTILLLALVLCVLVAVYIVHDAITVDKTKAGADLSSAASKIGTALGNAGRWFVGLFKRSA